MFLFSFFGDLTQNLYAQSVKPAYFSMCVQTDTASVLHETIEYIKFLHDQVGVSVCAFVYEYYHDSPPLIIAHLKP